MPIAGESNYNDSTDSIVDIQVSPVNEKELNAAAILLGTHDEHATDIERKGTRSDISSLSDSKVSAPSTHSTSSGSMGCEDKQLTDLDHLKFQSTFLQVIEELRMRRGIDVESEEHIKELVSEKHALQQKLEEEKANSAVLIEAHYQTERKTRLQFEEKIKQAEHGKAQIDLTTECWDRELKALKDEIRALHLVKYNLEKKVTEQERQLHLQASSRDGYLSQMNQLDQNCSVALKQAEDILEQMERLEANVRQCKDLHVKLQYVNEHQKCELEVYRSKLKQCQLELKEARVRETERRLGEGSDETWGQAARLKTNEQELKMQCELNKQLQAQLSGLRKEHQDTLHQLKEAHSLIERHVDSIGGLTANEKRLGTEVTTLEERVCGLTQELETSIKTIHFLEDKLSSTNNTWSEKYKDIEVRLESLQNDYTFLQETHDKHSESKSNELKEASLKITQLEENQMKLQEELELAKMEAEKLRCSLHTVQGGTVNKEKSPTVEVDTLPTMELLEPTANILAPNSPKCIPSPSAVFKLSVDKEGVPTTNDCEQEIVSNSSFCKINSEDDIVASSQLTSDPGYSPEVLAGSQSSPCQSDMLQTSIANSGIQLNESTPIQSKTHPVVKLSQKLSPKIRLEKLHVPRASSQEHNMIVARNPITLIEDNKGDVFQTTDKELSMRENNVCETKEECQPPTKKHKSSDSTVTVDELSPTECSQQSHVNCNTIETSGVVVPSSLSLDSILLRGIPSNNSQNNNQNCSQTIPATPIIPTSPLPDTSPIDLAKGNITSFQNLTLVKHDTELQQETSKQQDYLGTEIDPPAYATSQSAINDCKRGRDKSSVASESGLQFSIVFSSDDEDDNCKSTQMNKQLDKVQKFLKKDRLRRQK